MSLLNYTTEVAAMKSIGEIQGKLVAHGATSIIVNFSSDHEPESLSFIIPTSKGDIPFRLPANVERVAKVLDRQNKPINYHPPEWYAAREKRIKEQAARVAWRILKVWVDAQLAIIETEMVSVEEVFLPYMIVKGQTLYEVMTASNFMLPEGRG